MDPQIELLDVRLEESESDVASLGESNPIEENKEKTENIKVNTE